MSKMDDTVRMVKVDLGEKSYPIYIGPNILLKTGVYVKELGVDFKVMVVTNPTVRALYGETVTKSLAEAGFQVIVAEIPDGEQYKSMDSARLLYDIAFENNMDRNCVILALGGGVIGDLAGFVASTYMRGVQFVQVPTTLLAQVDSSVGGKVAVNHPKGKNIIGSFYQPRLVISDTKVLSTLPQREFRAGMAEVIKYGIIWDRNFFEYMKKYHTDIEQMCSETMVHIVETSCSIKARVVEQDETEQGQRAILNYGHTFGHAYESLTNYKKYVHGEAVAIGMVTAAKVAVKLGMLKSEDMIRIEKLIQVYGLPVKFGALEVRDIIESMSHDKKVRSGQVRYVLPLKIGRVEITSNVPETIISDVLRQLSL